MIMKNLICQGQVYEVRKGGLFGSTKKTIFLSQFGISNECVELMYENETVRFDFGEMTGVLLRGKKRQLVIYPQNEKAIELLFENGAFMEQLFAEIDRSYEMYMRALVDERGLSKISIQFGYGIELINGALTQHLLSIPFEKLEIFDLTTPDYEMIGPAKKHSKIKIYVNPLKARNLNLLKHLVRAFTQADVIQLDEGFVSEIDVAAILSYQKSDVGLLKLRFDEFNTLENGVFKYQGKALFSLDEATGYEVKDKKCNLTGISKKAKGKKRTEYMYLVRDKVKYLDVLNVIVERFTDAVIVKKYEDVTKVYEPYHLSIDEVAVKLHADDKSEWIEFDALDGMSVCEKALSLTFYTKDGLMYLLDDQNTDNLLRNLYQVYDSWFGYLKGLVDEGKVEEVNLRFGDRMVLEGGIFRSSSQKGIALADAKEVYSKKDQINVYCDEYGMYTEKPMNQDILKYLIYELGTGIEGYDKHWNADFLKDEKMKRFETLHGLSLEQEKDLAFAAILTVTNYQSPRTFKIKKDVRNLIGKVGFKSAWGIGDKASVLATLDYLSKAKGQSPKAQELFETYFSIVEAGSNEEFVYEDLFFSSKYLEAKRNLIQLGYNEEEVSEIDNFAAWDYGRTGYIARYSVQFGLISEEEVWPYVELAARNARKSYRSWREYLAAYVLGRALGYGDASGGIYKALEFLLEDEDSPYVRLDFEI